MSEQTPVESKPSAPRRKTPGSGRKAGTRNKRTKSFDERYERYRRRYKDPVGFLFRTMADEGAEMAQRVRCAVKLVEMRYPQKKAVEIQGTVDNTITLRDMRTPNGVGTTIDVTPAVEAIAADDDDSDEET